MNICIILLRGINVGGHRKVPMAELRKLLIGLGFQNVKTYIQSGNVVLQTKETSENIKSQVEKAIQNHFGFDVLVQVKTYETLKQMYDDCPFKNEEKEKSYFMMLDASPDKTGLVDVSNLEFKGEKIEITNDCIYLFSEDDYGRTKFNSNFFERKLKVNATARNYKTILKLLAMAEELQAKL